MSVHIFSLHMNNSRKEVKSTAEKPDPVMTATEVAERLEALNAAIRERQRPTDKWMDDLAARVADALIESFGDDISADLLEQLIAIRDGKND